MLHLQRGRSKTTFTRRGLKMSTFCQRSYDTKCQRRGIGGQKKPESCQRSLWTTPKVAITCRSRWTSMKKYRWIIFTWTGIEMELKLWFFLSNILQHNMKAILFLTAKLNPLRAIDLVSGLTYSFHYQKMFSILEISSKLINCSSQNLIR